MRIGIHTNSNISILLWLCLHYIYTFKSLFHDLLCQSYVYHSVWSGITGRISLQITVTDNRHKHVCIYIFTRLFLAVSLHRSHCEWSLCTVVSHRCLRTLTRYYTPVQTLNWTLSQTKYYAALTLRKTTIFQSHCIGNVWINVNIYIKISCHYCIRFNLCSLILIWHCIWRVEGLHSLSQTLGQPSAKRC